MFPAKLQAARARSPVSAQLGLNDERCPMSPLWLAPSFASSVHERPESGVRGGERPRPVGPGNGPDHCAPRQTVAQSGKKARPAEPRPSCESPREASSRSSAPPPLGLSLALRVHIRQPPVSLCSCGVPAWCAVFAPEMRCSVCCDVCGSLASWGGITVGQTVACSSDMSTRIFAFCLNARLCHFLFFSVTPALNDKGKKMKALCLWLGNKRLGSSFVYKKMAPLL